MRPCRGRAPHGYAGVGLGLLSAAPPPQPSHPGATGRGRGGPGCHVALRPLSTARGKMAGANPEVPAGERIGGSPPRGPGSERETPASALQWTACSLEGEGLAAQPQAPRVRQLRLCPGLAPPPQHAPRPSDRAPEGASGTSPGPKLCFRGNLDWHRQDLEPGVSPPSKKEPHNLFLLRSL